MLRLLVQLPELLNQCGDVQSTADDINNRIYGQHGFSRWFERHFYVSRPTQANSSHSLISGTFLRSCL